VSISYCFQVIVSLFVESHRFKPGLPQGGIAGPDEHSKQVTGNSQVAMADVPKLTWLKLPVAQPRLPGGHLSSRWT